MLMKNLVLRVWFEIEFLKFSREYPPSTHLQEDRPYIVFSLIQSLISLLGFRPNIRDLACTSKVSSYAPDYSSESGSDFIYYKGRIQNIQLGGGGLLHIQ